MNSWHSSDTVSSLGAVQLVHMLGLAGTVSWRTQSAALHNATCVKRNCEARQVVLLHVSCISQTTLQRSCLYACDDTCEHGVLMACNCSNNCNVILLNSSSCHHDVLSVCLSVCVCVSESALCTMARPKLGYGALLMRSALALHGADCLMQHQGPGGVGMADRHRMMWLSRRWNSFTLSCSRQPFKTRQ